TLLRGLAALGLGLGVARVPGRATARKKRTHHMKHNHKPQTPQHARTSAGKDQVSQAAAGACGLCQKRKKGQCVPVPDGTSCAGGLCQGGLCQAPPDPTCEGTCPGCCANGQCFPGDTNANCGKNGAICAQCASDDVCTPEGICGPPPTCGTG